LVNRTGNHTRRALFIFINWWASQNSGHFRASESSIENLRVVHAIFYKVLFLASLWTYPNYTPGISHDLAWAFKLRLNQMEVPILKIGCRFMQTNTYSKLLPSAVRPRAALTNSTFIRPTAAILHSYQVRAWFSIHNIDSCVRSCPIGFRH